MSAAEQTRDVFDLVGQVLEGRFQITRLVAEGGFGVVYQGQQLALDRPVAVKALKLADHPGRLSTFREIFAAEAKTMARLRHPNIADVYDSGITQLASGVELPWIALEWLDGLTLEAILNARQGRGGLGPAATLALMRPALEAFAHAHRQGVAHRDIKPGNMIQTKDQGIATMRVLDFGISKIMLPEESAGSGRTRTTGGYCFSPAYASPEQISGGRTGPWTDVHALGLVLTEVLTDRPPVEDVRGEIELYARLLSEKRPTPGSKGKNLGPWERVLDRAMALQPSSRWKDAGQLLDALVSTVDEAEQTARAAGSRPLGNTRRGAATQVRSAVQDAGGAQGELGFAGTAAAPSSQGTPSIRNPGAARQDAQELTAPSSKRGWLALVLVGVLALAAGAAFWFRSSFTAAPPVTQATPAPAPAAAAPPVNQPPPVAPTARNESAPATPAANQPAAGDKSAAAEPVRENAPGQGTTGKTGKASNKKAPGRRDKPATGAKPAPSIFDPSNMDIR